MKHCYGLLIREKKITATVRQLEAVKLRNQGKTYREIGEFMGVGIERARQLCAVGKRKTGILNQSWRVPHCVAHLARIQGFDEDKYDVVIE